MIHKTMQRIRTFESEMEWGKLISKTGTKIVIAGPKSRNSKQRDSFAGISAEVVGRRGRIRKGILCRGRRRSTRNPEPFSTSFRGYWKQLNIPAFNFHMLRHILPRIVLCRDLI